MRDNPGQDLAGLNRDLDKAQEITKDKRRDEDLYVSSNSVEKIGEAADAVGKVAAALPEVMQRLQDRKQLVNGTADERSAAAQRMFQSVAQSAGDTPEGRVVADALGDLAQRDPKAAGQVLDLLSQYDKLDSQGQNATAKPGVSGLVSLLAEALIMSAGQNQQSGGAGGGDGLDPTSQAPGWTSGTSIGDSTKLLLAREIVNLLLPTWTSLPIFQPDNSPLTNPGSGTVVWDPGSAGYGAGGKVELPSSTGGSRIDEQGGWSTTTSGDPVAGLGVVHSSANTDGDSGSAEIVIDTKISSQITERGWTEQDIRAVVQAGVIGTAVDKRSASKTPDGLPRNDSASVYGSKEGYVVVNDRTKEVVQISGRNDPGWIPDSRINWR